MAAAAWRKRKSRNFNTKSFELRLKPENEWRWRCSRNDVKSHWNRVRLSSRERKLCGVSRSMSNRVLKLIFNPICELWTSTVCIDIEKTFFLLSFLGPYDITTLNYSPDGNFVNHQQSVTFVVRAGHHQIPLLCWVLLFVLLVSIFISITVICCFCVKARNRKPRTKERSRVASHINGFSPARIATSTEMLPKYVSSPAQSYSTQKLYQWCQQKKMQQYKSLWAVNPTSGKTTKLKENFQRSIFLPF